MRNDAVMDADEIARAGRALAREVMRVLWEPNLLAKDDLYDAPSLSETETDSERLSRVANILRDRAFMVLDREDEGLVAVLLLAFAAYVQQSDAVRALFDR